LESTLLSLHIGLLSPAWGMNEPASREWARAVDERVEVQLRCLD
jgi:hypothetical protein